MLDNYPLVNPVDLWKNLGDQRSGGKEKTWSVARLVELSKDLPIFEAPVAAIATDYTITDSNDIRNFVAHVKKVLEADLDYPIILAANGVIMDGRHRLAKAILEGRKTIKCVRFEVDPPPD